MTLLLLQIEMKTVRPLVYLIVPGKPDRDLCNSARWMLSKVDIAGVLHRAKVFPWEMSPAQPNPPSFISKLNKTAGQRDIDTPGTVYL